MKIKNGLLSRRNVSEGGAGNPVSLILLLFRLSFLSIMTLVMCRDKERVEVM